MSEGPNPGRLVPSLPADGGRPPAGGAPADPGGSIRMRVGGRTYRLRALAVPDGGAALLCETRPGEPLPAYPLRRLVVRRAERRCTGTRVLFVDRLRGAEVWGWVTPWPGGPGQYREHAVAHDGDPPMHDDQAGRAPLALQRGASPVAEAVVGAIVRLARRRGAVVPVGHRGRGGRTRLRGLVALQQWVEASEDPAAVRAVLGAVRNLTILDPCCSTGERLVVAFGVLRVIYDACLQRLQSSSDDDARAARRGRRERGVGFRRALARASDTRHHPTRAHHIGARILRDNLFGADPDPARLQECARRLADAVAGGPGEPRGAAAPRPNLLRGDLREGYGSAAELRSSLARLPVPPGELRRAIADAEVVFRARRVQRIVAERYDPEAGSWGPGAGSVELEERIGRLRAELDRWRALAAGVPAVDEGAIRRWVEEFRPLHAWLEYGGLVGERGFEVVLAGDAATRRNRRAAGVASAASPASIALPVMVRESDRQRFSTARRPPIPRPPMPIPSVTVAPGDPAYPARLLDPAAGSAPVLHARGDVALLGRELLAVFGSVRVPADLVVRTLDAASALRERGIATIGGFQSPLERECLAMLLGGAQPVVVSPARRIEPMRLPGPWHRALAEGRLLLVSRFDARHRRPTTRTAELRNLLVGMLAERVLITYATPGGRLAHLARLLVSYGRPVFTWDDPRNADLVRAGAHAIGSLDECLPPRPPPRDAGASPQTSM